MSKYLHASWSVVIMCGSYSWACDERRTPSATLCLQNLTPAARLPILYHLILGERENFIHLHSFTLKDWIDEELIYIYRCWAKFEIPPPKKNIIQLHVYPSSQNKVLWFCDYRYILSTQIVRTTTTHQMHYTNDAVWLIGLLPISRSILIICTPDLWFVCALQSLLQ